MKTDPDRPRSFIDYLTSDNLDGRPAPYSVVILRHARGARGRQATGSGALELASQLTAFSFEKLSLDRALRARRVV